MTSERVILKPVPGTKRIFASSDGRIFRHIKGMGSYEGRRYVRICLNGNKKRVYHSIARVVAETFLGPCPPGLHVCHRNGNPKDDSPRNLRYDTPKGNSADCVLHGTRLFGELIPRSRLKEADVLAIRRRRAEGVTYMQLAREYGVAYVTVRSAALRLSWKHI